MMPIGVTFGGYGGLVPHFVKWGRGTVPHFFHHLITKSAVKMMLFVCFVGQLDSWSPTFQTKVTPLMMPEPS
jgi:hypothetical protein